MTLVYIIPCYFREDVGVHAYPQPYRGHSDQIYCAQGDGDRNGNHTKSIPICSQPMGSPCLQPANRWAPGACPI